MRVDINRMEQKGLVGKESVLKMVYGLEKELKGQRSIDQSEAAIC